MDITQECVKRNGPPLVRRKDSPFGEKESSPVVRRKSFVITYRRLRTTCVLYNFLKM